MVAIVISRCRRVGSICWAAGYMKWLGSKSETACSGSIREFKREGKCAVGVLDREIYSTRGYGKLI